MIINGVNIESTNLSTIFNIISLILPSYSFATSFATWSRSGAATNLIAPNNNKKIPLTVNGAINLENAP